MSDSEIKGIEVTIDGFTETVYAKRVADNIYYCLESLIFGELQLYGSEIEVKEENEKLKFVRIHKESNYQTHIYLWSKEFLDSERGKKIKDDVLKAGGDWEQVMGGFFFIYLPKEKEYMLEEILKNAE